VTNNIFVSSVNGADGADCGLTQAKACATISAGFATMLKQPDEPGVMYSIDIDPKGSYPSGTASTVDKPLVMFDHASVQVQGNGATMDGGGKCASSPFVIAVPPTADVNVSLHIFSLTITNFKKCTAPVVTVMDQRQSTHPARVVIENLDINSNSVKTPTEDSNADCGGGLFLLGSATPASAPQNSAPALVVGCKFTGNQGPSGAGACIVNADVANTTFVSNVGRGGSGYGQADGGGLLMKLVTSVTEKVGVMMTNVTFVENEVDGDGGGLFLTAGRLGDSNKNAPLAIDMTNLAFSGNAASGYGGGMFDNFGALGAVYKAKPLASCTGCVFMENSATINGGGMALMGSATSFDNLEVTANECSRGLGAGIYVGLPKDDVAIGISLAPLFNDVTAAKNDGAGKHLDLYCVDAPLIIENPSQFSSLCSSGCTNLEGHCACRSCGSNTPPSGGMGAGWVMLILIIIGGALFGAFKVYKRSRSSSGRSTYLAL
jgi:hypothetical protein